MRSANFVSETTTSIGGTNGNGDITLTAIANTPRISTTLGTGKVFVNYVIEKISTGAFERGIGYVTSNVLTRVTVMTTWNGSTYVDTGTISPLAFGSSPTSGDVIVRLSATAETQAAVIHARQTLVAGDTTWRDYPISAAFANWNTNGSGAALAADTEYYFYYKLDSPGQLKGIQIDIAASGGTSLKAALYDMGPDGLPGSRITTLAGFNTSSSGVKTDTSTGSWSPVGPIRLTPGWYIIGMVTNGTPQIRGIAGGTFMMQTPVGRRNGYGYSSCLFVGGKSYASGMPATPNLTGGSMADPGLNSLACAWIGMRVEP